MNRLGKLLWPGPILFTILWLALQANGARFLQDPGTFWHITTGDKILSDGFIATDPYTFTFAGTWWIPYQWLGEVIMAIVHGFSGFDGVLSLATAIVAGLFSWLATRWVRTGITPIFAIAVTLVALAATANHFHARPLIFTQIAMAITMTAIIKFDAGRIGLRQLAWLIPLCWVWTNIHGGMLGGVGTMGFAFLGWLIYRVLGWPSPLGDARTGIGVALIGIACTLTMFLSPYGTDMPKTWLWIMGMEKLPDLIIEHARFDFADPRGWPMLILAGLYLLLLSGLTVKPKVSWLIPLVWLVQALLRVRHGSLFSVVCLVAMIDFWPYTRWAIRWNSDRPDLYTRPTTPTSGGFWPIALTAALALTVSWVMQNQKVQVPFIGANSAQLDPELWPMDLIPTLREYEPRSPGSPNKLFNGYIDGGFVMYHAPGYRVFVDDRCEVFGDDWLIEFVWANEHDTAQAMTQWQHDYGDFDFALTRKDCGYDQFFASQPDGWHCVQRGHLANFYVKR